MKDYVIPDGNEKELILMAEALSFKELMFLYPLNKYDSVDIEKFQNTTKIKIHKGILISMIKDIFVAKKKGFTAVEAGTEVRGILEAGPNLVFGFEEAAKKDYLHHRGSGLNHVLAKIANNRNVTAGFSFSSLLRADSVSKALIIGRMSQNKRLFRKYKVKFLVASFARTPDEMRAAEEMKAMERII